MNQINKFWLFVAIGLVITVIIIITISVVFWQQLSPPEKEILAAIAKKNLIYFLGAFILVFAAIGFTVDGILHNYIIPMAKLSSEAALMKSSNPDHRVEITGGKDIMRLAGIINEWADYAQQEQEKIEHQITHARSEADIEKNILAEFLAEMPDGILACTAEGKILLYNKQARRFLSGKDGYGFVGLGRLATDVIDKYLIVHALDEINEKIERSDPNCSACFVVNKHGLLLRVEIVPVLDHLRKFSGYLLALTDITEALQTESRANKIWRSITHQTRASLASIRASIETILMFPEMNSDRTARLHEIIHSEALDLGEMVQQSAQEFTALQTGVGRWPLNSFTAEELISIISRRAREKLNIEVDFTTQGTPGWLRIERYSFVLAILTLLQLLKNATGHNHFNGKLTCTAQMVGLDLLWPEPPVKLEDVRRWETKTLAAGDEALPFTIGEVMEYHQADLFTYAERAAGKPCCLRIFLPTYEDAETERPRGLAILPEQRPEYFDFDLFNQPGLTTDLNQQALSELTYTVFDTETTGLNPTAGDCIIAIGAVRIVNGRVLRDEHFDKLINPQRPIPTESTQIHGITDEMVRDEPPVTQILPAFERFAQGTILVAHNAAFDMRMLQMTERTTGIKLTNPVLDTLLLSAVVHPAHQNHNLRTIAGRMGIQVHGRHTALGDAMATAQIFLKLLPLLADMGVYTLNDALEVSKKTYYSRLRY
jgi:DNA polymerase-3 subunit epsilon